MTATSASIYVQDHGFFIGDRSAETPFETMDYSTGLGGVMESAVLMHAGIDRGYVTVSVQPVDRRPDLDTDEEWADLVAWDDVAEISLYVPSSVLAIAQHEYGPFDARPEIPLLSSHGPGHYRLRIHASDRDRYHDQVVDQSDERFHIIAWPAPPKAPLIIKATSWCGYGLRLNAIEAPSPAEPAVPTPEEQAEAERQALLRRRLLDIRDR